MKILCNDDNSHCNPNIYDHSEDDRRTVRNNPPNHGEVSEHEMEYEAAHPSNAATRMVLG